MILIALSLQKSLFVNRFPKKLKFEECVSHTDSSTTTNGSTDDDAPATRPFLSCLLWGWTNHITKSRRLDSWDYSRPRQHCAFWVLNSQYTKKQK
mmetsp:Transcript_37218/g.43296  ORF Transcript_37218/g.43296 Transcript_37218/m.43296 type:complete len:95 (+) Transcript_37218:400-684(+)